MHVLHLLYEPRPSGISRHVIELVRGLPDLRHSVLLPRDLDGVAEELRRLGACATKVPMRSRVLPATAWRVIPRLIRDAAPDLVHLHSLEAGVFGALAARRAGARRVVFTPQTVRIRNQRLFPVYAALLRLAGRSFDAWVAVSRGQVAELERLAPAGRVRWVPNCVPAGCGEPTLTRAEARRQLGWPVDRPLVAAVGRLAAQKDPWTFVRAADMLPEVEHVLVGEGPLAAELAPAAARTPNLRLQGRVVPAAPVYAAADVICLPSRWEGLPYVLLEALARGCAVVATRIAGNEDLVEHEVTGLLSAPGDPIELSAAIGRLAHDPALRARLGRAGSARVATEYSPEAVAERMRRVYEEASPR